MPIDFMCLRGNISNSYFICMTANIVFEIHHVSGMSKSFPQIDQLEVETCTFDHMPRLDRVGVEI